LTTLLLTTDIAAQGRFVCSHSHQCATAGAGHKFSADQRMECVVQKRGKLHCILHVHCIFRTGGHAEIAGDAFRRLESQLKMCLFRQKVERTGWTKACAEFAT
jgi:hypothetical protein